MIIPEKKAVHCYHCGLALPTAAHYPISCSGASFDTCCRGCQAVAQMIVDSGNADYYRHRTELPASTMPQDTQDLLRQLQLYDLPEIQRSFVKAGAGAVREAALILEGIVCAACIC